MRHHVFGKKLGRNHNQRKALQVSLVRAFFMYGQVTTTNAKAIFVRPTIEKLLTLTKTDNLTNRRELFKVFQDRTVVKSIFSALQASQLPASNYTKITKKNIRSGDSSLMVDLVPTFVFSGYQSLQVKKKAPVGSPSSSTKAKPKTAHVKTITKVKPQSKKKTKPTV